MATSQCSAIGPTIVPRGVTLTGERLEQMQRAAAEINQLAMSMEELATSIIAVGSDKEAGHYAEAVRAMAMVASLKADLIARALGDPGITPFSFALAA